MAVQCLNVVRAAKRALLEKEDYQRLCDNVNTTKHKSLIPAHPSVDLQQQSHGIRIAKFPMKSGGSWPECWSDDFIENSYAVMHTFLNYFWIVMLQEIAA